MLAGTLVVSRLDWDRNHFQVIHMVIGRIQFFVGCWHWLEAALSSLSCGSLHRASHNMKAGFMTMIKLKEPGSCKTKFIVFIVI